MMNKPIGIKLAEISAITGDAFLLEINMTNNNNQNEIYTLRQHIANLRDTVYSIGLAIDSVECYSLTPAKPLYDILHSIEGEITEYSMQLEYLLNL